MRFIVKRVIGMVLTLLLVSVLTFGAFNIIPGDPAAIMAGVNATDEEVEILREKMGLNRPPLERYAEWLGGFFTGDYGTSLRYGREVGPLIASRIYVTFWLAGISLAFILLISFPVALLTSRREGNLIDRLTSHITTASLSVPNFFLAVIIVWVFGLTLKFFVAGKFVTPQEDFAGFIQYLIFPAIAVALPLSAMTVKFLRGAIFSEQREDYVKTALAGGASRGRVLSRHVLRNAVIPTVTFLGMIIGDIFGGSIIVEQVFGITGIGRLLITSITARDFPLLQTLVVYIAFVVVLANSLVDIAIALIDPRIRVES